MKQAIRACAPSTNHAPFFDGPKDQIDCPPGHAGPIGAENKEKLLLKDEVWKEYVVCYGVFQANLLKLTRI